MENVTTIVFGMGRSGISALKLLSHLGENSLALNSLPVQEWVNPEILANSILQMSEAEFLEEAIERKISMVLSPGIPRTHPIVQKIFASGGEVISEIELGYRH
jgi:UDP-N-acetylmuramoylalanine--D-glutamate ligase